MKIFCVTIFANRYKIIPKWLVFKNKLIDMDTNFKTFKWKSSSSRLCIVSMGMLRFEIFMKIAKIRGMTVDGYIKAPANVGPPDENAFLAKYVPDALGRARTYPSGRSIYTHQCRFYRRWRAESGAVLFFFYITRAVKVPVIMGLRWTTQCMSAGAISR